jgi:hypothetical protein
MHTNGSQLKLGLNQWEIQQDIEMRIVDSLPVRGAKTSCCRVVIFEVIAGGIACCHVIALKVVAGMTCFCVANLRLKLFQVYYPYCWVISLCTGKGGLEKMSVGKRAVG